MLVETQLFTLIVYLSEKLPDDNRGNIGFMVKCPPDY